VNELRSDDGERKQVTVLFADVSGSMDLAEQQDPEEWRKIMQRFFSILADAVTRFEGTVDKFTGDGIMAVFGAPVAYEDHARRACYAALQMLDDVAEYAADLRRDPGLNFSTRIGVNSGEVVAGAIGDGAESEYTAIGHTVGLAQRMEALAEPGKAYLTEQTAALARGFLDLEDLGEFAIKGASKPVRVFELAGVGAARSRLDLARERGFSRFVGRSEEMGALEEALALARAGEGRAIGLVAEAGTGKSRLSHEFVQRCRESEVEVFEAQAQAHGQSIPFMPVLQMLRSFFGIGEREGDQLAREKIAGRALLLDPAFGEDLPLLFDFLGVPDPERPLPPKLGAEARQRALGAVVCRLVNHPGRRKTLVLVIEDLHWIDAASDEMFAGLIDSIEGTRTLVLVNYRPEYEPSWGESALYRALALTPLERAHTAELLRDLAGEDPSLDGLDEPIHERTQGNPFFIEEIVRELAESGHLEGESGAYRLLAPIDDARVPVTVQAILAARIDRLGPEPKRLLQAASVVGKEVSSPALGMTAELEPEQIESSLGELIESGFLYDAELYPQRVLAFRHPLTREVAYGSQLADHRRETHRAAARATIELEPGRLDELAGLVGHHMAEGGETLEAARWFARAAHWAGHSQPRDALALWQRVTALTDELEEDEETVALALLSRMLQLEYAWRLGMDPAQAEALAAEATEIAERRGDVASQALLKLLTGARPGVAENAEEWVRAAVEAIELADSTGDPALRIAVRSAGAYAHICAGDLDGIEACADEMLELAGGDPALGAGIVVGCPLAWGRMAKAMALRERNRNQEAHTLLDEALQVSRQRDDPETESWALGTKSLMLADAGDIEGALALVRRNRELTERLGDVFSRSTALTGASYVLLAAGELEEALATVEEADRAYRSAMRTGGEAEAWRSSLRARALLALGRREQALEEIEWAVATAKRRRMGWQIPPALHTLAQARAALGRDGVEEALAEATEYATARGHLMSLDRIEEDRAALTSA
jgi:class 3 adenylate cyclase/tetratricopeptide (TPR) repeat protein